jgi:catechol 2,3-dioxygenase-like lactoylglutathione lyase family enzyme
VSDSPVRWAVDHVGFTVPDLDVALELFCDVLGCELVLRGGPYDDAGYVWPGEKTPERRSLRLAILRHGEAHNIELLEYRDPGARNGAPEPAEAMRPSQGGHAHIAFYVSDVNAAVAELRARAGVELLGAVTTEQDGPLQGLEWVYVLLPWGMVIELIRWPPGMPYERTTSARMAPPPSYS